ncbi:MAG: putative NADPH-dependent reductase [Acidimicrobiales bacterium]|nr:putative NADPH-dependent reductase [Acidimicrobiales bacterium]
MSDVSVGIFGATGPAGSGLAARLASVGIEVVIGSRDQGRAESVCQSIRDRWPDQDLPLKGAVNAEAAKADVIVIATPWDAAASTAGSVAEHLDGKVVISMANALAKVGNEFDALVPPRGSVAAHVQAEIPHACVAAAFHHLPARELANLAAPLDADVLVCSDHPKATAATIELVGRMPALRGLDAGSLANATAIEALTAVLLQLNVRYKTRAGIRITGVEL